MVTFRELVDAATDDELPAVEAAMRRALARATLAPALVEEAVRALADEGSRSKREEPK